MAYSESKLKSNGLKASPCFRTFWIENYQTNVYLSFKHILMSLSSFMDNCGATLMEE
jgi:hypothetical protein